MRTNCVNCGAAIDSNADKCPFCETSYYDLTAIDFGSQKPVACRFKMPYTNGNIIITTLAVPSLDKISMTTETQDIYGGFGSRVASVVASRTFDIGVSFLPVAKPNGTIFELSKEE